MNWSQMRTVLWLRRNLPPVAEKVLVRARGSGTLALRPTEVAVTRAALVTPVQASTVLTASGYIVARAKAEISPKSVGRIAWLNLEEGQKVRKGELVARLESQELSAQRQQALAQKQTSYATVDRELREIFDGSLPERAAGHERTRERETRRGTAASERARTCRNTWRRVMTNARPLFPICRRSIGSGKSSWQSGQIIRDRSIRCVSDRTRRRRESRAKARRPCLAGACGP